MLVVVAAVFSGLVGVVAPLQPPAADAATASSFQAGYLISDSNFFDSGSLSASDIQSFLNSKVSNCRPLYGMPCMRDYVAQSTPALAANATWRYPFLVMGASGLVIGLIALLLIREPRHRIVHSEAPPPRLSALAAQLVGIASYRAMMAGMALGVLSGLSFGLWGPTLFARAYAMPIKEASTLFGLAFGIAGLVGMLSFGAIADSSSKRDPTAPLRLAALALAAATALIVIVTWTPGLGVARWLAVPCGLLGGGWSVGVVVALQNLLPDRIRATGTALGMLAVNLLGAVGGPWLAGALSDAVGGDPTHSLRIGLSIVMPLGFVGAWLIWRSRRSLVADRERLVELDG